MKYLALVSGGKDSIYSIHCLQKNGHQIVCLLHMRYPDEYVDSYMYQTVGSEIVNLFGDCLGVPIFVCETRCKSINKKLEYVEEDGDEVEDLYAAIKKASEVVDFEGVSSGAIMSKYQKNRVENVCKRLSMHSLAPLWEVSQKTLLEEMIFEGIDARVVKVASSFMGKHCINMNLVNVLKHLHECNEAGENFCGEGGEYETIVLDCRMFIKRIYISKYDICKHPEDINKEDGVFYMKPLVYGLEDKN